MIHLVAQIGLYLIAVSFITFALFGWDKSRSRIVGARRVPERNLLFWAFIGGSPGALMARKFLRHKTRKQPFVNRLRAIIALQLIALITTVIYLVFVNG